MTTNQFIP